MRKPCRFAPFLAAAALVACAGTQKPVAPSKRPPKIEVGGDTVTADGDLVGQRVCISKSKAAEDAFIAGTSAELGGDFPKAVELYQAAIEADPDLCDALDNLGRIYRRDGKNDQAIDLYKRSLAVAPENLVAMMGGWLAYEQNDAAGAIEPLTQARDLYAEKQSPYLSQVEYMIGMSYLALKKPETALPFLERARDAGNEDAAAVLEQLDGQ